MALEPINTATILTTSDPIPNRSINVPGWIVTETMEITFGDYSGRPDVERVQLAREMLAYFFSQGWVIVAVVDAGSGGKWESVSSRTVEENRKRTTRSSAIGSEGSCVTDTETDVSTSETKETGKATSKSNEELASGGGSNYSSSYRSSSGEESASGSASGVSTTSSAGSAKAEGSSLSEESTTKTDNVTKQTSRSGSSDTNRTENGEDVATGGEDETRSEVQAYWSSWQKVRLQRKRIHPRKVLESMVGELVESYNKGEKAVSERYTAVVSLYTTMLSNSENELAGYATEVEGFKDMMGGLMDALKDTLATIRSSGTDDKVRDAEKYQRLTINEKFDALVSAEKSRLISAGLFNSTQWTMIAAGIERERGIALLAVSDKVLGWRRDLAGTAAALIAPMQDAAKAILQAGTDGVVKPMQLRNEVLKWMLDYCERHNTERAKIEDVAQLPKVLDGIAGGYAEM